MNQKIKNMLVIELGISFFILILFILFQFHITNLLPPCKIHQIFEILCPSCGGTRCVINFMQGNFQESFGYHPIFFLTLMYLLLVNGIYIINTICKKEIATNLYPKEKFWMIFLGILVVFTIIRNLI